jgi:hypothetical protein
MERAVQGCAAETRHPGVIYVLEDMRWMKGINGSSEN